MLIRPRASPVTIANLSWTNYSISVSVSADAAKLVDLLSFSNIMTQNRAKYASEVIISKDPASLNKDPSTLIGTKLETAYQSAKGREAFYWSAAGMNSNVTFSFIICTWCVHSHVWC